MTLTLAVYYLVGFFGIFLAAKRLWEIVVRNAEEYQKRYIAEQGAQLEDIYSGISPQQLLLISLITTFAIPAVFALVFHNYFFAVLSLIAGYLAPKFLVKWMRQRRFDTFTAQLVDAMDLISNSLKAGYSLPQALQTIVDEMKPPISQEFAVVMRELKMGKSIEDALNSLAARIPSEELDLVVVSIIISRQTGGNLSEIMENIASTVRQRNALQGKIKSLTAQGKLQGIIVGMLPIGLGFILNLMDPKMMAPMFHTWMGYLMLGLVVVLEIAGAFLIKKIVTIDI